MEYEDNQQHGPARHGGRDLPRPRLQLGVLREAGAVPGAVHRRGRGRRPPGAVGDGGVQAAAALSQRCALQEDLRKLHGLQKYRHKGVRRAASMMMACCS